jgi:hypothetical protein
MVSVPCGSKFLLSLSRIRLYKHSGDSHLIFGVDGRQRSRWLKRELKVWAICLVVLWQFAKSSCPDPGAQLPYNEPQLTLRRRKLWWSRPALIFSNADKDS